MKRHQFLHAVAMVALATVAIVNVRQSFVTAQHLPDRLGAGIGAWFGILIWLWLLWKLWSKPRGWSLGLAIFLAA